MFSSHRMHHACHDLVIESVSIALRHIVFIKMPTFLPQPNIFSPVFRLVFNMLCISILILHAHIEQMLKTNRIHMFVLAHLTPVMTVDCRTVLNIHSKMCQNTLNYSI